jgi:UDPglucose 6-dehydrogenase
MEIMVFGAGYVGLVTGAGLASTGNQITIVDTQLDRVKQLEAGRIPIYEPELTPLIHTSMRRKNISFLHTESSDFKTKLEEAEIYFIAVGTPDSGDGRTDLSFVDSTAKMIAKQPGELREKIVVVKSTVPIGTGDRIEALFKGEKKFPTVVSNPEFLKEGTAVEDFLRPERVVIGTENQRAREILGFLYEPFMLRSDRTIFMKRRSAELLKYACNTFLATKISFINELSELSEISNADIREVRLGMISDKRIGEHFLFPGIGYGGSCFPKDVQSLIVQAKDFGIDLKISSAAHSVNLKQRLWAWERLIRHLGSDLHSKIISLWGISFKPETDDIRESPAAFLIKKLISAGAAVQAHDPVAMFKAHSHFRSEVESGRLRLLDDPYQAAEDSDALMVMTEWREFRSPNFKRLRDLMKNPLIIDGRNIYNSNITRKYGFTYYSVGATHDEKQTNRIQRLKAAL